MVKSCNTINSSVLNFFTGSSAICIATDLVVVISVVSVELTATLSSNSSSSLNSVISVVNV